MADYSIVHDTGRVKIVSWTLTTADPTGEAFPNAGHFPDKSFQVYGTFGGSTVILQGTNEVSTTSYLNTLTDVSAVALSFTSAGLKQVIENTHQLVPSLSGGSGVSVTVLMLLSVSHR